MHFLSQWLLVNADNHFFIFQIVLFPAKMGSFGLTCFPDSRACTWILHFETRVDIINLQVVMRSDSNTKASPSDQGLAFFVFVAATKTSVWLVATC